MNPLLTLSHISYSYHDVNGETLALSDISFSLEEGRFLAIVGPSGCGNALVREWKHIRAVFPSQTTSLIRRCKYYRFSGTVCFWKNLEKSRYELSISSHCSSFLPFSHTLCASSIFSKSSLHSLSSFSISL